MSRRASASTTSSDTPRSAKDFWDCMCLGAPSSRLGAPRKQVGEIRIDPNLRYRSALQEQTNLAGGNPPALHTLVDMRMGPVHLTVSSLPRSLDYYENVVGLQVRANDGDLAHLGVGDAEDLLVLYEEAGARP